MLTLASHVYLICLLTYTSISAHVYVTAVATHYTNLLVKLKPEWHTAFWSPNISAYSTGTQMAQAAAIWLDDLGEGHVVPPANMPALVKKLGDDCADQGVTIGFVGVRYMFEAL